MLEAAELARAQFAFTISYHILFPTLSIGLASYLMVMEGLWLKTKNPLFLQQFQFFLKPFAITFGMGVVSGVVLSYEFGTNFSEFSTIVGPVLSPLLSYEVLTAFFLEASFLGIMLFGRDRVHKHLHFAATCIVCIGTYISAFWILAANSWMHTPAGYEIIDGQFHPTDWFEVIFNPSFPYRYTHMMLASLLSTSLVIAGINAHYLLKNKHEKFAKLGFSIAMWLIAILAPLQIFVGDLHGLNVAEHQPVKLAAMEGLWETEKGAGFRVFAIPNQEEARNSFEIVIPKATSLLITHDLNGEVPGLDQVAAKDRPPVSFVFFAFRTMLGIGGLMLLLGICGIVARFKGKLFSSRFILIFAKYMIPAGFIATLAGWYVVEVGRQPWLVNGLVRTRDVISPVLPEYVGFTLVLFIIVYSVLFTAYLYYFRQLVRQGPSTDTHEAMTGHNSVKEPSNNNDKIFDY